MTKANERSDNNRDQNEELIKFLNELRVMLPGVQVLFAFLLTVPFTQRFQTATQVQQGIYLTALLCAAASTILIIAPSIHHRLRWHEGASEDVMATGNRFVIVGTVFLAIAIAASVSLVADVLYGGLLADVLAAVVAAGVGWLWWGLPLLQRSRDGSSEKKR